MDGIHVTITKNTQLPSVKKQVRINPKDSFEKILSMIGSKLGIEAKVLYSESGALIEEGQDIRGGETIYVSQGEQFLPKDTSAPSTPSKIKKALKLGVIGPASVGKSALSIRYTQRVFIDEYLPSFENLFKKEILIEKEQVEVDILDSSGMDELVVMRPAWFMKREAFLLVFAVNDRDSFNALTAFRDQLVSFRQSISTVAPLIIVGNKADLVSERVIKFEEARDLAKSWGADYMETSAKKDTNVTAVFEALAKKLYSIKYAIKANEARESKCPCIII
eukprot:TRINITY_DN5074_c0_g3_i4.p1 TRINITY_DN5074_c0_g3~~TRINITY_DN5074_c0_g3_i4.p1  ORF type:complete len:278 (+),score=84.33 TRINITY_DN5074_c0_g3_i4:103-936(+)